MGLKFNEFNIIRRQEEHSVINIGLCLRVRLDYELFESINFYFLLLQSQVFITRCRKSGFSECTFCVSSGNLGALRLKVRLIEDHILPSVYYQPLIHLLVESVVTPTEVSLIHSSSTFNPCWFTSPVIWASLSAGRGEQCSDPAGGGDHSREPTGRGHDPGEDLPGSGSGCAVLGLPQHPRGPAHQ